MSIKFIDQKGTFVLENANAYSFLYFPLVNDYGMKSSITPSLAGDAKINQNHFALLPVTQEDLMSSDVSRNVFFLLDEKDLVSTSGMTPLELLHPAKVNVEGGFLYQTVTRTGDRFAIKTTSFVPTKDVYLELHQVTFSNTSDKPLKVKPTVYVPLYARSAMNVRDHRHVSSLFNRAKVVSQGVINTPTLCFDETGHKKNEFSYGVFVDSKRCSVTKYWPIQEEFVGEGHTPSYPLHAYQNLAGAHPIGDVVEGYEVSGGFEFEEITLPPHDSFTITLSISISRSEEEAIKLYNNFGKDEQFVALLEGNRRYWENELCRLSFHVKDDEYSSWLKWVSLQPTLRRLYGNSFMPHHDYGKGGRGWRDLWQDCLTLLIMDPNKVKSLLYSSFMGVRMDGSNATIIGEKEGEFLADRNNIVRVWMDHGAWPLYTVKLYLDRSGDLDFLFLKQSYFKDQFSYYTKKIDPRFKRGYKNTVMNEENQPYQGSILEHLLLENLIPFYNVGEHHLIRLEDADWNDGMDMAKQRGESVAFTSFYAFNLKVLADILTYLWEKIGLKEVELLTEIQILLEEFDFRNIETNHLILNRYFEAVQSTVSGKLVTIEIPVLIQKLLVRSHHLAHWINHQEWLENDHGEGCYNGYYDNDGKRLESLKTPITMTLTGQVFPILGGIANQDQIAKIIKSANHYLYDSAICGYRLNTKIQDHAMNLGRFMGFGYGHKENGAMFSHMAIMFANALIKQGFIKEGRKIIDEIASYVTNPEQAKIYPGIPEYIDKRGRGVYHYLTGSASWVILTMVDEVFGIKGYYGHLLLQPKLMKQDFIDHICSITTMIGSSLVKVVYHNEKDLDIGDYQISQVKLDHLEASFAKCEKAVLLQKNQLQDVQQIDIYLN